MECPTHFCTSTQILVRAAVCCLVWFMVKPTLTKATIRQAPREEAYGYTSDQLLRGFISRSNLTETEWANALTAIAPQKISETKVGAWMTNPTPPDAKARAAILQLIRHLCHYQVADEWTKVFTDCWERFAAQNSNKGEVFKRHHRWIDRRYKQPILGEAFTLSDIYVAIKIIDSKTISDFSTSVDAYDEKLLRRFATHGLPKRFGGGAPSIDWVFVKGGPGSGKSALAQTLAHSLSKVQSMYTVFIRGTRLDSGVNGNWDLLPKTIDDSFSAIDFISAFCDAPRQKMILVLDGLDEFGTQAATDGKALDVLNQIEKAKQKAALLGKTIRIIAFGRDTITTAIAQAFRELSQTFEMGDLSGELPLPSGDVAEYSLQLKTAWWEKLAAAKHLGEVSAYPNYLLDPLHPLFEISREPLLAFLIAKSSWPHDLEGDNGSVVSFLDQHTAKKNKNEIYFDIINRVRSGGDWKEDVIVRLPQERFLNVLRYMALATWHNATLRAVSIREIKRTIGDNSTVATDLEHLLLELGGETPAALLTAFYYRYQPRLFENGLYLDDEYFEIEFTHRTFVEYLLATSLLDKFEELLGKFQSGSNHLEEGALTTWLKFTQSVMQTREIASFVIDEARLRYPRYRDLKWRHAKNAFDQLKNLRNLDAIQIDDADGILVSERLNSSSAALMLCFGAVNRAHFEVTGKRATYDEDQNTFGEYEFQSSFVPFSLGIDGEGPTPDTFSVHALAGVDWKETELPGFYASGGEVYGSKFKDCVFEASTWGAVSLSETKLDDCNFRRSRFQDFAFTQVDDLGSNFSQSSFNQGRLNEVTLEDSCFEQTTFLGLRCVNSEFNEVAFDYSNFYDCSFQNCTFEGCSFDKTLLSSSQFKGCEFIDCSFDGWETPETEFADCSGIEQVNLDCGANDDC